MIRALLLNGIILVVKEALLHHCMDILQMNVLIMGIISHPWSHLCALFQGTFRHQP